MNIKELTKTSSEMYVHEERNRLIALISVIYPASLERHFPENDDWPDDWRWVVIIDLPGGQVSWHIPDKELYLFDHLKRKQGRVWDWHNDREKFERIINTINSVGRI
jgi:hypothetical protein